MKQNNFRNVIFLILTVFPLTSIALPKLEFGRFLDNDSTTLDTETGLEWLDVPKSQGLSYNAVIDQTKPGGQFSGYRYAESEELLLLIDFFFPEPSEAAFERKARFTGLFGRTNYTEDEDGFLYVTTGMVDPKDLHEEVSNVPRYTFSAIRYLSKAGGGWSQITDTFGPEESNKWVGSFLVRKSSNPHVVPEIDASSAPMALNLLLFTALLRWERRKRLS